MANWIIAYEFSNEVPQKIRTVCVESRSYPIKPLISEKIAEVHKNEQNFELENIHLISISRYPDSK